MTSPYAGEAPPPFDDHFRGNPEARVTVMEYADYECPYCAAAAPVLRELVDGSEGDVRLVFRNFPLPDVHPYALTAALAAEATAPHGVFWQMHDLLFARQHRLTDMDLSAYADSLGVDGSLVVGDHAQPYGDKVEADFAAGVEMGVVGTPSLFIDGVPYRDRIDLPSLRRATRASSGGSRLPPWPGRQGWRGLLRLGRTHR